MRRVAALVTVFVLAFVVPVSAAAPPNYHWNPIPVVGGQQNGWTLDGFSYGVNRTFSNVSNACTNCYRWVQVRHPSGAPATSSSARSSGSGNGIARASYPASWGFLYANHEIKFKSGGLCYVHGRQVTITGGVATTWGPFQVTC